MAVTKFNDNATWYAIKSGMICPICSSKKGRCSVMMNYKQEEVMYRCKYAESNRPSKDGWYLHLVSEMNGNEAVKIKSNFKKNILDYNQTTITEEDIILWDKVYSKMKVLLQKYNGSTLYKEHKDDLIRRGLSEANIMQMGYFSIPRNEKVSYKNYICTLKTAIINDLLESFNEDDLVKVPGFSKVKVKNKEFVTFKNSMKDPIKNEYVDIDAYFIPYKDVKNRICGMQYRLTNGIVDEKGKLMRFFWYSSKVSCGSPIDYYIPGNIKIHDVILITEGAIKAKIAGNKLGIRTLAEAGVTNYRKLIQTLQEVEKNEGKKYKIISALDMDKYTNNDVLDAEISTVTLLKSLGYSVTLLEWNVEEGKGIDDKLVKNTKGFRFITI